MALVDVTELLLDPDFVNDLTIVHRVPTVNTYGVMTLAETSVATIGVVQPASGKDIQRLPESLRVKSIYTFWIRGEIKTDGVGQYADLILYGALRFAVINVLDYLNWPAIAGWSQGMAVREDITL